MACGDYWWSEGGGGHEGLYVGGAQGSGEGDRRTGLGGVGDVVLSLKERGAGVVEVRCEEVGLGVGFEGDGVGADGEVDAIGAGGDVAARVGAACFMMHFLGRVVSSGPSPCRRGVPRGAGPDP